MEPMFLIISVAAQLIIDAITGSMNSVLTPVEDVVATDKIISTNGPPSRPSSPSSITAPIDPPSTQLTPIEAIEASTTTPPPSSVMLVEQEVPQDSARNIVFLDPYTESNAPRRGRSHKVKKKEVVQKARVRREEIAAELVRAKTELWETTIEQAVLIQLAKDKDFLK